MSNELATAMALLNGTAAKVEATFPKANTIETPAEAIAAVDNTEARIEKENARRAKYGKAKMTAEEAKRFAMFSARNAAVLESTCEECTAYEDWFTFNRWIAQGKVVAKGQHGTKITVYMPKEEINRETGAKSRKLIPKLVTCFCRHQVKALEAKGRAA